jgi:hypothetical protein
MILQICETQNSFNSFSIQVLYVVDTLNRSDLLLLPPNYNGFCNFVQYGVITYTADSRVFCEIEH